MSGDTQKVDIVSMGYTRVEVTEKGLRFSRDSDKDARRFQCQSQSNMDKMKIYWNVKNFKIKSTEIHGQKLRNYFGV